MDGWPIRQQARRITHAHWAPSAIVSAQSCIGESLGLVFVTCIFPFSSCSVFIHIHICVCVCVLYDNACMYHEESSQNMHDFWPRNLILLPFGFFLSLLCNDFVSLNWWWCYLKQCQGMGCVCVCVCVCVFGIHKTKRSCWTIEPITSSHETQILGPTCYWNMSWASFHHW